MFLNSLRISYIDALVLIIVIPCSFLCLLPESSPPPSWLSFFSFCCCCFLFPTHWVCFGWPETPQTGGYRLWGQPTRSRIFKGKPISWRSHELHMMASQLAVWFVSATVLSVQKMFGCSLSKGLLSVILPSLSLAWSLSPGGNVIKKLSHLWLWTTWKFVLSVPTSFCINCHLLHTQKEIGVVWYVH